MLEKFDYFTLGKSVIAVRTRIEDDGSLKEQHLLVGRQQLSQEDIDARWDTETITKLQGVLRLYASKYVTKKEEVSIED